MFPLLTDGVAVYVYREVDGAVEFLQMRRIDDDMIYPKSWQIVYGGANEGETAAEAAYRELKEETGLTPIEMHLVEYLESFYFRPKNAIVMLPVFVARVGSDAEIVFNEEHDEARWVPESDVDTFFAWRSQREAIRVILEAFRKHQMWLHLLKV